MEIHPDDAKKHGITPDDWVRNLLAARQHPAARPADHRHSPGVIHCQHGWWFPERKGWDHGIWESNVNLLTSQSPPYDPAMGTYQLRGLLCRIEKCAPAAAETGA